MDNRKNVGLDRCPLWLKSKQSSYDDDIFGEPKKFTRIGDRYQAEIPDMIMKETIQNEDNKFIGTKVEDFQLPLDPILDDDDDFLLGMYIFGKNFHLVNKFTGKGMSHVLSCYYGPFYGNDKRKEWSSWMNRNQEKIPGMKIFKGWRLEELFTRIFPYVTDEYKTRLTRATRMLDDKQITFVTYIFNVLDMVGIKLLVQAIAIGKGNQDLTSKSNNVLRNKNPHPPFSSLTTEQVLSLLKYGIELNKEKLIDLFQEAVWPRLLAQGWKSTPLRTFDFNNSKNSLVFLAPGIKNFSPRGQTKGTHYFMSFVDVLNKVALEPQLLEADEDMLVKPSEKQSSDNRKDVVQFMIVDSNLKFIDNQIFKMREMRSMPDYELINEQGSSCESPNQSVIRNSLAPEENDESETFNQDFLTELSNANIDQQCGVDGESLLEDQASVSNNHNKRKGCPKENTALDLLDENALGDIEEHGNAISSTSKKSHI